MVDISRIRGSITVLLGTEPIAEGRGLPVTFIISDMAELILSSSGLVHCISLKYSQ